MFATFKAEAQDWWLLCCHNDKISMFHANVSANPEPETMTILDRKSRKPQRELASVIYDDENESEKFPGSDLMF